MLFIVSRPVTLDGGIVVLPSETLESSTSATHNQQPSSEDRRGDHGTDQPPYPLHHGQPQQFIDASSSCRRR
jgi:hypothetical protein